MTDKFQKPVSPPLESNLHEYRLIQNESKIHMKSDSTEAMLKAIDKIKDQREMLLRYIRNHPEFQYAFSPVKVVDGAPIIVRMMTKSSTVADVGPMASVAGALADLGVESMLEHGARVAVVENGGEIAIHTNQSISVAILSSSLNLSGKIGFHITQQDCPLGMATSSSKTGHAISFGEADSVTVAAQNASLADAAATAICNSISGSDLKESIQMGLRRCGEIPGVRGVLIIRDDHVGLTGRLPRMISVKE